MKKGINKIIRIILKDKIVRTVLAKRSHFLFFLTYFGDYMEYKTAKFQKEMFKITEKSDSNLIVVAAFRGSAKSTIMTMSYPVWAILGKQQIKHIVILSQTQEKAQIHLMNIRRSLEEKELLNLDMGPLYIERNQWGIKAITIRKYNARISTGSLEQGIRGLRFNQYRPQLVIIDDIEDYESVQTIKSRNKVFNWFVREIVPAMEKNGRIVVVGTLLHKDSFISRLKNNILDGRTEGVYKEYPIVDQSGQPQWKGKFPTLRDIEKEKMRVMDEAAWQTEYMLNPTENTDSLISPKWIHYYDVIPSDIENEYGFTGIGIDLAISKEESANHTAMVSARVYCQDEKLKIYILPNPIKEKLTSLETLEKAKWLFKSLQKGETFIFSEDVAYQRSFIENLINQGYPAEGVKVSKQDKYSRLKFVSYLLQAGNILFPKNGNCEELIKQLVYFEPEGENDMADAFSVLIMKIIEKSNEPRPKMTVM